MNFPDLLFKSANSHECQGFQVRCANRHRRTAHFEQSDPTSKRFGLSGCCDTTRWLNPPREPKSGTEELGQTPPNCSVTDDSIAVLFRRVFVSFGFGPSKHNMCI